MIYRKLGNSDLNCSVIGLGTWAMGGDSYGKVDDDVSVKTILAAVDAGINLIDTAPVSYTHLDVYKRQDEKRGYSRGERKKG